jgi:hypothetical protein
VVVLVRKFRNVLLAAVLGMFVLGMLMRVSVACSIGVAVFVLVRNMLMLMSVRDPAGMLVLVFMVVGGVGLGCHSICIHCIQIESCSLSREF